jgi:signal peptidase II
MSRSARSNDGHNSGARWLWLSFGILVADRATKFAIERYTNIFYRRPIIPRFVTLVHNRNPGIAFGFFSESTSPWVTPMLLALAAAMILLLAWLLLSGRAGSALAQFGLALILGGAAGNALDRILHRVVTDFLEVRLGSYVWPAFNVADSAITIGAILVLIELMFDGRHPNQ